MREDVIVIPAEGPSLGIAPSGKWICTSWVSRYFEANSFYL